ncbi:hypothetical protein D3C79_751900 [compost metagenome]
MVDQFLRLQFGQFTGLDIALNEHVQEGRYAAEGHGCTVLGFHRGQVAEVGPLYGFLSGAGWARNVVAVFGGHFFNLSQGTVLFSNFFAQLDGHFQIFAIFQTGLQRLELVQLVGHQEVDTVQSNATVVTDDTATAIRIWQTGQHARLTAVQDVFGVNVEYALVVGFAVFGEHFLHLWVQFTAINLA